MSDKLLMVQGGALGHGAGSLITGGTFTIVSIPSLKVTALDKSVFRGDLLYTFLGGVQGTISNIATVAPQVIKPTALKCLSDNLAVVRLGDSGTMAAQGVDSSTGATVAVSGPVEVVDAGQDKVSGI